jgi:hypothetical protein
MQGSPHFVLALAAILASRSSDSTSAGDGFAGTYATDVTLSSTTCGPVTVQDNPTVVEHQEGASAVSFRHAGTTYSGTVAADSSFTTTPKAVSIGDGYNYTITIAGRFNPNAFEANATVNRSGGAGPCQFVVHWAGTR